MSASSWPEAVPVVAGSGETSSSAAPRWSLAARVAFRFLSVYLVLYTLEAPVQLLPFETAVKIDEVYAAFWKPIVTPVAIAVFGMPPGTEPTGSGDSMFGYAQNLVYLMIAAAATLIWSAADRRRLNYTRLWPWFHSYVRFMLAATMLMYAAVKVVKLQFGPLLLDRLTQPFGTSSPMGLLWTFMGFSTAYTFFAGFLELAGAVLLTTRRTALLGALITAGVMANVVMMNLSYDVPVKQYSMHLLFMAAIVAAPDARRLLNFFVRARAAEPPKLQPSLRNPRTDRNVRIARSVAVVLIVAGVLWQSTKMREQWDAEPNEKAPLWGIWNVDALRENGVDRPPLTTDAARLRRIVVSSKRILSFDFMDEKRERMFWTHDEKRHAMTIRQGPAVIGELTYRQPDPKTLLVSGTLRGRQIEATLHAAPTDFPLLTRGFHWITEMPVNR
jgi:hypothetical protein